MCNVYRSVEQRLEHRTLSGFEKVNGSYSHPQPELLTTERMNNVPKSQLILDPSDISLDMMGYLDVGGLDDEGNAMATFAVGLLGCVL